MIEQNQNITQREIASKLKTTVRTVERNINGLKEKGILHKLFEGEEEMEDSLTYVGEEDEDPFEK